MSTLDERGIGPIWNPEFRAAVLRKRRQREAEALAAEQRRRAAEKAASRAFEQAEERRILAARKVEELRRRRASEPEGMAVSEIFDLVAARHGMTTGLMLSSSRARSVVAARHEALALVYRLRPDLSLPQIGRLAGGLDHTTVLHAVRKQGAWRGEGRT